MASTYVSREVTRDALVALFDANAIWNAVYGYVPKATTLDGKWPLLVVTSAGTRQDMLSISNNPTYYTFACVSFVLMDDEASWNEDDAEDKIDEIDKIFRQIIRDNASGNAFAHSVRFADTQSRTDYMMLDGRGYRTEQWMIVTEAKNT